MIAISDTSSRTEDRSRWLGAIRRDFFKRRSCCSVAFDCRLFPLLSGTIWAGRSYVSERKVPSYRYEHEVRVGADLPSNGVTYHDVPKEYGVTNDRYTVVNDRTVLVDPSSHRIIQLIE